MSKYLAIEFPNQDKAYEGTQALRDLHREGSLSVYAAAVVEKQADGRVVLKDGADEGPVGTAVGLLTGSLVGLLGGPAGVVVGMAGGALLGSIVDLENTGVGLDFVDAVGQRMSPNSVAVIAEVEEYWLAPLDARIKALGGTIHRRWRVDFADQQIEKDIQAWNDELDQLDAEFAQARDDAKAAVQARLDEVKSSMTEARDKVSARIDQLESEASARIQELKDQLANASAEAKAKIENRINDIRKDYDERKALLREAGELTKQALTAKLS